MKTVLQIFCALWLFVISSVSIAFLSESVWKFITIHHNFKKYLVFAFYGVMSGVWLFIAYACFLWMMSEPLFVR